jgi:hypothetical protein
MSKPKGSYNVRFEKVGTRWIAYDDNGDYRAYGESKDCIGQSGMDLARSIFHAEEIESVEVVDGVTTAKIYFW